MSTQMLLQKMATLEQNFRDIKVELFHLQSSKHSTLPSVYAEQALLEEIKSARADIWNRRYAKKIKGARSA